MKSLFDLLRDPSIDDLNIDCEDRLAAHSKIPANKLMLGEVFAELHHTFLKLDDDYFSVSGKELSWVQG